MIDDALGMAELVAPCIFEYEFEHAAAAKAVLRGAVLRWNEAGTGASQQLVALGFSQTLDTRQTRRSMFWPAEIEQLQSMCVSSETDAYGIDTMPYTGPIHADVCALNLGANYCSCGADLTRVVSVVGNRGAVTFPTPYVVQQQVFTGTGEDDLGNDVETWAAPGRRESDLLERQQRGKPRRRRRRQLHVAGGRRLRPGRASRRRGVVCKTDSPSRVRTACSRSSPSRTPTTASTNGIRASS